MRLLAWLVSLAVLMIARYAAADPAGDAYDGEDPDDPPVVSGSVPLRDAPLAPPHAPVALTLSLFGETRIAASFTDAGATNVGILGAVTVPLERVVESGERGGRGPGASTSDGAVLPTIPLPLTRELAGSVVRAAWKTAGLENDAELDAIARRARVSGLLPDARFRVLKRTGQSDGVDVATSGTNYNDTYAIDDVWMEGSVTFHLERLVFATEEVPLARVRLGREAARERIAHKALAALAAWQRAGIESRAALPNTPEALEAAVKMAEDEAELEILTGGWFAAWEARARPW